MEDFSALIRDLSQVNLIQIGLILAAAWLLVVIGQRFLTWLSDRFASRVRFYLLALIPMLRLVVIIVAIVMLVPRLIEPSFENLIALLGALGLALGFAFKDYVSSLIAGVVTLFEMPYRPGDWIDVEGAYGEVKEIKMRSVEIVTPDDTVVVIPHLMLWDRLLFNANNGGQNLMCVIDFYLHPRHDASHVKNTLSDVALTSAYLQMKQPIKVIIMEKPWGTHYRLKAYPIDPRQQFDFITDLTVRGKAALTDLGVEFTAMPAVTEIPQ